MKKTTKVKKYKKVTTKNVAKSKTVPSYKATIKIFGKWYEATGNNVAEAVTNLKNMGKVGGACVLTIQKGEIKREKIINSRILFGLFNGSSTLKEIALKNINSLFGDI